ncbi:DUF2279 domain-containing protein [Sphingomonas sabuli]|uniref:DUF2279 domain-containing protein n=1 Tax=Sphingomonas sabuli TaxID=2764186 RepID=A0A7G9L5C0_9SPHN|nr:DUF2279 domain-containing protein [Sphingomonas sabuli]QNM83819.1 DUF2279 domain-containing protein [Sphingomonas sabuli]
MSALLYSALLLQTAQPIDPAALPVEAAVAPVPADVAIDLPQPAVEVASWDLAQVEERQAADAPLPNDDDRDDEVIGDADDYSAHTFWTQAKSIPWRLGGAAAVITATGFANWDWGSSRFRFNNEGLFGRDTASLGMDKLGHAWSSYVLAEFFADGIETGPANRKSAAYTGAILSMGLMTYIEVFDGFSAEHGFSIEDLAVDTAGALLSVARRSIPGLQDKLDFRLLYVPSGGFDSILSCFPKPFCDKDGKKVRSPITDYSGQRYLMALKLAGFDRFKRSPLRLVELHGGYYARGFTQEDRDAGKPLRRRLFFGLGLNVGELLFPNRERGIKGAAKWALDYIQLPYTAIHSK